MKLIKGKDSQDYVSLGVFQLHLLNIEVRVMPKHDGGSFNPVPEDNQLGRIWIGLDWPEWKQVLSILIHESFEFVMTIRRLRYSSSDKSWHDHSDYLFAFTHPQFSDCCDIVAMFMAQVIPPLSDAYKKYGPKK